MRILVVNDGEEAPYLFSQEFHREIDAGQYTFTFALNLLEAFSFLDIHHTFEIMIILSEMYMPGNSEVLMVQKIREKRPGIHVVLITRDEHNAELYTFDKKINFITYPIDFNRLRFWLQRFIL